MREIVPSTLVDLIFKLNLDMKLLADNKKCYPCIIKSKSARGSYIIMSTLTYEDLRKTKEWTIELKGSIDVESVKYTGKVEITPVRDEVGYYHMSVSALYKVNMRKHKRVPYRRSIQIVSPIEVDAILINISASGAMIHSPQEIPEGNLKFTFILAKKRMELTADIVQQVYNEEDQVYVIRCHFNPITEKDKKHIHNVVSEIILMAKRRLRG